MNCFCSWLRPSIGGLVSLQPAALAAATRSLVCCLGSVMSDAAVGLEPLSEPLLLLPPIAPLMSSTATAITATPAITPPAIVSRLRRAAAAFSACSRAIRSSRRFCFSSCRLDTAAKCSSKLVPHWGIMPAMHADSRAIHNRLRRIEGQVRGLQRMVDEDAYCIDILTQVAAVQTALEQVAVNVLDGHVRHCVADAVATDGSEADEKLDELMAAVRRFAKVR